jgi:hypothetical protein
METVVIIGHNISGAASRLSHDLVSTELKPGASSLIAESSSAFILDLRIRQSGSRDLVGIRAVRRTRLEYIEEKLRRLAAYR